MELRFENVSFSYDGKSNVLHNLSFKVTEKERVALMGLNGSGKSTLMQLTNGLLLPSAGRVTVNGADTNSKYVAEVRKVVGLVFQDPDDQLFMPTVWEDVAFGPRNMKLGKEEISRRVEGALNITRTTSLADRSPFELSGGQKKSVSIATVLSMQPELLVMDEPTAGLDYMAIENFISIMKDLPQAFIISTHDIEVARRLCSRAIVMHNGTIVYDGHICEMDYPAILTKEIPPIGGTM